MVQTPQAGLGARSFSAMRHQKVCSAVPTKGGPWPPLHKAFGSSASNCSGEQGQWRAHGLTI
eukprot:CAMPEP_0197893276 /NCGR_PEP_ID=MMETSP1439-20131203/32673_1 /TAXON_ID=66791 /ORGANISM="Gonyaulax spinifera, Strain CCMP409" /LENGTH=61 /DNA_ID=CAMNT_0043513539 /DNA_START=44 /DNA_END=229 /DNA_ORIENTATION=-